MGYIYKIINKVNGMIYVGQTIQFLEERWKQHRKISSNCFYLKSAFKKYGIEQFEFKMICICFDEELDKFEIQYMKSFNSMVPNGYNLRNGGNSGRQHEETKKKISETLKGRTDIIRTTPQLGKPHTEEIKQQISNALKGRTDIIRTKSYNWIGKHHTEESKNKMRESHKIKINQYDLDNNIIQSFNSISEAAIETGIDRTVIGKCCKNIRKTAGGFKWQYL
jgi:group I intron endonuclease